MKRLLRGSVVLAVAVGFLSCSGDPTDSFREPSGIVATPTTLFIDIGETKPVIASLQDDQGSQIAADYEITAVGPGITVVQDTTFLHSTAPGVSIDNQARFQVTGSAIANSSFTLSAGGQSLVVPVRVTPANVDVVISNATPAWGDTITLTAPAGVLFTDTSVVTFAGGAPGDIVSLSPDRTVLTVVPGPNTAGAVTISNTTVAFNEALNFTITSNGTVTSPPLLNLEGATLSNQTPALGEVVTLTLPPGIRVDPTAAVADSGVVLEGAINPRAITVALDSGSFTFIPAPNSDSTLTIRGVAPAVLPQFPQILQTTLKVTTPAVDSLPATVSSATPAVNVPVVLTSTDANFTFVEPGTVTVGAVGAIVTGQTATTLTFLPVPGSTGNVAVGAVDVVGFGLPLPSTAPTVTTSATVPSSAGTGAPGTAPAIAVPTAGQTRGLYDTGTFTYAAPILGGAFGTFPARLYRIVVPAGVTINLTLDWPSAEDLGGYWFATDGTTEPPEGIPADNLGGGGHPEQSSSTLSTGTYLLAVVNFSATNPAWFKIEMSGETPVP